MAIHVFTDGASRGNPGNAGAGVVILKDNEVVDEIKEYLGKKTNNEAEYEALILALEKLKEMNVQGANIYCDSEFMAKQMQGKYRVKAEKIKPLFEKANTLASGLDIKMNWIPRDENSRADALANAAIDEGKIDANSKVLFEKAFFGKINCFKVQLNKEKEVYFHLGLLNGKVWSWTKVKMSDVEIGDIIHILKQGEAKCSFYHSFGAKKTQIWCRKSKESFSIKIGDVSKNLSIGEFEVLKIVLEETLRKGL